MSKSAIKILNTAEHLFNQYSFSAVGVDLIRDESGCSKTTMYTYYKNKNQLVESVLNARDEKFKHSLYEYIGDTEGIDAIHKILAWHTEWFRQDNFKGCLFVRAVAESNAQEQHLIQIAQHHKQWIKDLIQHHCQIANKEDLSEIIYTILEGLISRFLVDGEEPHVSKNIQDKIMKLLNS